MKIIPVVVFCGVLLLTNGLSCNALERFHFSVGGIVQGALVMEPAVDHNQYFQTYQFYETDLTKYMTMLGQVRTLSYALPAILFWFQTMDSREHADRSIRIKRWAIRDAGGKKYTHYDLFGPKHLQPSLTPMQVTFGIQTLPEVLLAHSSFTRLNIELVFLIRFFTKESFACRR